jgi:hypothetical protein
VPYPVTQEDPERRRAEDDGEDEETKLQGGEAKEEDGRTLGGSPDD